MAGGFVPRAAQIRLAVLLLFLMPKAGAQTLDIGLKGGASMTNNRQEKLSFGSPRIGAVDSTTLVKPYAAGPTVTLGLTPRVGVEIDALYRRLNNSSTTAVSVSSTDAGSSWTWSSTSASRLDLSVLLQWSPGGRFFVVGGPVVPMHFGFTQHTHRIVDLRIAGYSETMTETHRPVAEVHRLPAGLAFGGGYVVPFRKLFFKPELRYTWWRGSSDPYRWSGPGALEFVLGIEFRVRGQSVR